MRVLKFQPSIAFQPFAAVNEVVAGRAAPRPESEVIWLKANAAVTGNSQMREDSRFPAAVATRKPNHARTAACGFAELAHASGPTTTKPSYRTHPSESRSFFEAFLNPQD